MFEKQQMLQSKASILCQCVPEVSVFVYLQDVILIFTRINVKLGGINTIPDPASVRYLTDPANPTVVMGTVNLVHLALHGLTR